LRDLHTLYWIAKYLYGVADVGELVVLGLLSADAANRFAKAQSFLWSVRCHLHYVTGREEDRLTFDIQQGSRGAWAIPTTAGRWGSSAS